MVKSTSQYIEDKLTRKINRVESHIERLTQSLSQSNNEGELARKNQRIEAAQQRLATLQNALTAHQLSQTTNRQNGCCKKWKRKSDQELIADVKSSVEGSKWKLRKRIRHLEGRLVRCQQNLSTSVEPQETKKTWRVQRLEKRIANLQKAIPSQSKKT